MDFTKNWWWPVTFISGSILFFLLGFVIIFSPLVDILPYPTILFFLPVVLWITFSITLVKIYGDKETKEIRRLGFSGITIFLGFVFIFLGIYSAVTENKPLFLLSLILFYLFVALGWVSLKTQAEKSNIPSNVFSNWKNIVFALWMWPMNLPAYLLFKEKYLEFVRKKKQTIIWVFLGNVVITLFIGTLIFLFFAYLLFFR